MRLSDEFDMGAFLFQLSLLGIISGKTYRDITMQYRLTHYALLVP